MNVNLTPELESLIQNQVESGLYNNQSEVVRAALRLFAERLAAREAHLEGLRRSLGQGLADLEGGEVMEGSKVVERLKGELGGESAAG